MNKTTKAIVAAAIFTLSSQASATLLSFANGGFEGYTGNTNTWNSDVPPGWTTTGGTPDTFNANTTLAGFTWEDSSTGGDFLHGIGWQPRWTESAVQQGLNGLVIGQEYEISFEQSISRSSYSQTGGFWSIQFGDEVIDSDLMAIPDAGVFSGWTWQTLTFTATAETQQLTVSAISDTNGSRTDLGIDSFYVGTPGGNNNNPDTNVPAPAPLVLLSMILLGLGSVRRTRK